MAKERNLLTGLDLNEVQEKVLMILLLKEQKRRFQDKEDVFEQQLLVHRPEMYEKYKEYKQDNEKNGYDTVVWGAPETLEEAEELIGTFASIEQEARKIREQEGLENFVEQLAALEQFEGIDISLLGDDDG